MTIGEIRETVSRHKPVSRPQLYNYFKALGIEPIGARQRPQRFPENSATRILVHLGYIPDKEARIAEAFGIKYETATRHAARIPTMPELRAVRKKARGK